MAKYYTAWPDDTITIPVIVRPSRRGLVNALYEHLIKRGRVEWVDEMMRRHIVVRVYSSHRAASHSRPDDPIDGRTRLE